MTQADDMFDLRQRYVMAIFALSDATAVISKHARAGTTPTTTELQDEDDARVILTGVSRDFFAAFEVH